MKKIQYFGIGSNGFGSLSTCSFGIEMTGGKWMLVDCGPDTPRQLKKSGIAFNQVETLLVTHSHLDHCGGVPYFLFGRNLDIAISRASQGRSTEDTQLTIVSNPDLAAKLLDFFHFCHPDVELQYTVRVLDIRSLIYDPMEVHGNRIQSVQVDHSVTTYGFRIDDLAGNSLAYSSDSLPCDLFVSLASGVDVVIHEAMFPAESEVGKKTKHATSLQAGEIIKRINPKKKAFMMHIQPLLFGERQRLEEEASKVAGIKVQYPLEGSGHTF